MYHIYANLTCLDAEIACFGSKRCTFLIPKLPENSNSHHSVATPGSTIF